MINHQLIILFLAIFPLVFGQFYAAKPSFPASSSSSSKSSTTTTITTNHQCTLSPTAPLYLAPKLVTPVSLVHIHLMATHQMPRDPFIPSFLNESSQEIVDEYKHFLKESEPLNDEEIGIKFDKWMEKQSEELKEKYKNYDGVSIKTAEKFDEIHGQKIGEQNRRLIQAEKNMFKTISSPELEAGKKINELSEMIASMPMDLCEEFKKYWNEIVLFYVQNQQ